jgi:uncharacterized protein (TIGR03435 family)
VWRRALGAAGACAGLLVALGASVPIAGAQTPPPSPALEFDAATIKPNPTAEMRVAMRFLPGGAYEATNVTLRAMIQQAFRMAEFQVIGGPDWLARDRYDILAKPPAGATQAEFQARLQALLIERLNLKFHRETREAPVYALVLARSDGRLGPQIRTSTVDCSPATLARGRANTPPPAAGPGGRQQMPMPAALPPLGEVRPCSLMRNAGRLSAGGQTMSQLAGILQNNTGRIVIDRTGLTGAYDFDLEFTPDPGLAGAGPGGGLPGQPENRGPVDPDGLSIFTAIQEQLGLKLESTRAPVEVLVIDSADKPSEN